MHIEFRIPTLDSTEEYTRQARYTASSLIDQRMLNWAKSFPNSKYTLKTIEDSVILRFSNPSDCTLWAMTWDQHRGKYHSTGWKRIRIVE